MGTAWARHAWHGTHTLEISPPSRNLELSLLSHACGPHELGLDSVMWLAALLALLGLALLAWVACTRWLAPGKGPHGGQPARGAPRTLGVVLADGVQETDLPQLAWLLNW